MSHLTGIKKSRSSVMMESLASTPHGSAEIHCTIRGFAGEQPAEFKAGDKVAIDDHLYAVCSGGGRRNPFYLYLLHEKEWTDILAPVGARQGQGKR